MELFQRRHLKVYIEIDHLLQFNSIAAWLVFLRHEKSEIFKLSPGVDPNKFYRFRYSSLVLDHWRQHQSPIKCLCEVENAKKLFHLVAEPAYNCCD